MNSVPDLDHLDSMKSQKRQISTSAAPTTLEELGILNISEIHFRDDENWLVETPSEVDVEHWLQSNDEVPQTSPKVFDSRTFTRRRLVRPSLFDKNDSTCADTVAEEPISLKPNFDLSRPDCSSYFDNILANNPSTIDSFINMSPPSLVNSMCSSTFTNLMDNSYIKNDPVLREIRDTDFTVSVLQQESEPMLESYSSLNSDVMESLLGNETIVVSKSSSRSTSDLGLEGSGSNSQDNINKTFSPIKKPLDMTFLKEENITVVIPEDQQINTTITLQSNVTRNIEDKPFENVKRLLDRRPSPSMDLNRLSYIVDKNQTHTVLNQNKRNSFGSSDSLENGDYMSLSSGSSKSSHQGSMSNQGKYVQGISTPKTIPKKAYPTWTSCDISPISGQNSDPELSSTEKSKPIPYANNTIRKQKSVDQLNRQIPEFRKFNDIRTISIKKGSYPDLKSGLRKPTNLNSMGHTLKGSYTSLKPLCTNLPIAPPPLNSVNTRTTFIPPSGQVKFEATRTENAQFLKPKPVRPSALPRPASRIPGPRTIRPSSKSAGHQGATYVP